MVVKDQIPQDQSKTLSVFAFLVSVIFNQKLLKYFSFKIVLGVHTLYGK